MKNPEDKNTIVDILLEQLTSNSTARSIIEPPQIEGSTFNDWLYFFIQNAFIFFVWILSMVWVCYVIFYNSRLMGFIITKLVNYLFIKNGYFKMGSFSFAAISGKLMFRDLVYINEDYSIRIQDGWIVFCYWIPYVYRDAKTEDLSNSDVRLLIFLDGLKVHIYNQTKRYADLEKLFNLPTTIFDDYFNDNSGNDNQDDNGDKKETREKILKSMNKTRTIKNELKQSIWRDLIPMIKIEISSGRFIFGNHLIPSTLSISFEDSQFHYTSQPAASPYDLFTHILKGKAENLQVMLVPSLKYSGQKNDEPPRIMGDGFNVFRTNKIEIYYYQDVPGFVLEDSNQNETDNNNTLPAWGMVVKCGKGTDFSYGPWADRQRTYLYSFFFPPDYQLIPVDQKPKPGERRRFESFDIRLSTLHEAKIDILFSKNKETHALHINAMPGSYLEVTIPWVCNENGYTSHILGQILHLDATTSLQFRPLVSSETLEFDVKIFFPRIWNAHQEWLLKITACKAKVNLIFAHKVFIQDLIDDWSDKDEPDILKFIPYTWKIQIVIKDFELLVLANQYNWIDCSTGLNDENCKIAVCGEHFDMAFDLPFIEFLPPKLLIKIWIQGECLEGAFYIPECSANRDIIELIQQFSILIDRNGINSDYSKHFGQKRKWKNAVSRENHWYECMSAPIVALSITYDFWPMPILRANNYNNNKQQPIEIGSGDHNTELKELRFHNNNNSDESTWQDFDVTTLPSDVMTLELEIGPMNLALFGVLFRLLWNIKENYLGESQIFTEMGASFFSDDKFVGKKRSETVGSSCDNHGKNIKDSSKSGEQSTSKAKVFDPRVYRPFEVVVSVTLHEIHGHLVQCLNEREHYSPLVYIEKLCFELQKTYLETWLQLIISPAVLQVRDRIERKDLSDSFQEGFLTLSSLQFRGHAMFSGLDRPLSSETLEYAWLVDVEVGEIGGRITMDQLLQILIPLETFFFQIVQPDLELQSPNPFLKCLHDLPQNECPESDLFSRKLCPYPEDVKYRLVRANLNKLDVFLIESNVTINIIIPTTKLATCNLHVQNEFDGFTLLIPDICLRQFVLQSSSSSSSNEWAEISFISTGPIFVDSAMATSTIDDYCISQMDFLRKHDQRTKRLWFLWNQLNDKCGCVGNCSFFGCNFTGQNFFKDSSIKIPNIFEFSCLGQKLHDHSRPLNLNYGESLLHPKNYLLDIASPLIDETNKAIGNKFPTTTVVRPSESMISSDQQEIQLMIASISSTNTSKNTKDESSNITTTTTKSNVNSSDRFFSAEDLFSSASSSSNQNNIKMERSMSNNEKPLSTSSSSSHNWYSPPEMLSPTTQYVTAKEYMSSDGTSQKLSSLCSDSSTLIDNKNKNNDKSQDKSCSNSPTTLDDQNSINSFMSAVSDHQAFDLVDLRNQLEKPIIESPLLMSAYSNYLSVYNSENIDIPPPFHLIQNSKICDYFKTKSPQILHLERLIFEYRTNWKPRFKLKKAGFSETKLYYHKNDEDDGDNHGDRFDYSKFKPGIVAKKMDINKMKDRTFLSNNEVVFSSQKSIFNPIDQHTNRSRTATTTNTSVKEDEKESKSINVSNSLINANSECDFENVVEHFFIHIQLSKIQIKISTLTFDVMTCVLQSLTEVFSKLHPVTLLNHCSLDIMQAIESKNVLKKNKTLYLGQLHLKASKSLKHRQNIKHLNRSISFAERNTKLMNEIGLPPNILIAKKLEFDKRLYSNLNLEMERIDIISLQTSIVEEIVSFQSLDNIKDLTCVLVFNVSFNKIAMNITHQSREKRNLHVFMDQSSVDNLSFTEKALMSRFFTKKPKKVFSEIEINTYETTDAFVRETDLQLKLKNVQTQLCRLINSPEIVKQATLSVIPCTKTKVDFIFMNPTTNFNVQQRKNLKRQDGFEQQNQQQQQQQQQEDLNSNEFEHFNAFVMFECGIENLGLSSFKSSYFNAVKLESRNSMLSTTSTNNNTNNNDTIDAINDVNPSVEFPSKQPVKQSDLKGKLSNVWFHFASSPKKSSVNYKSDFDRYDWHLLSSLIPLTIAWISVFDRVIYKWDEFQNQFRFRICSSMACLMTNSMQDYLSKKNILMNKPLQSNSKNMIRIFSALTKTILEDPSFNLVNVLRNNFKNSFKTNEEFEAYFQNIDLIPNIKDLEKSLVLLLFHWKDVLPIPVSNFGQFLFRNQNQPSTHSTKMTFSSTKNQILALLEEKFNLMMNTPAHEATDLKHQNVTLTPDINNRHNKNLNTISSMADNESFNLNVNDFDTETTKLIYGGNTNKQMDLFSRDDLELQVELSSNMTRNTFPTDFDNSKQQQQQRSNVMGKRQNRVHFAAINNRFRRAYDTFLALPVVRNVSALCNNRWCNFCSMKKLRCINQQHSQDSDEENFDPNSKDLNPTNTTTTTSMIPMKTINPEISVNMVDCDLNDDDDFIADDQFNSSNFTDQKDLYWWMVKQQDYVKNVGTSKSDSHHHDMNLSPETTFDALDGGSSKINFENILPEQQQQQNEDNGQQKETTTTELDEDDRKLAQEIIRKYDLNWEATRYFDNFSQTLKLFNVFDLDKISPQERHSILSSDLWISFGVQQLCLEIEEPESDIQKNLFNVETLKVLRNFKSSSSGLSTPAFVCEKLSLETVILKKNSSQTNELISTNFKEIRKKNESICLLIPNFSHTMKLMLKSVQKKPNQKNDLTFEALHLVAFNIRIEQITQRINLPLLRFLHQFTAIYEDVSQTRFEMRANRNIFTHHNAQHHFFAEDNNEDDDDNLSLSLNSSLTNTSGDSDTLLSSSKSEKIRDQQQPATETIINIEDNVNNVEINAALDYRIENCWKTIGMLLEKYQQNKLKLFSNSTTNTKLLDSEQFQLVEDDFYTLYSGFINKPIIVVGNVSAQKMNLIVMLSGLKLEGELNNFNLILTHQDCCKKNPKQSKTNSNDNNKSDNEIAIKNLMSTNLDLNLDKTTLSLFESLPTLKQQQQLVVKMIVDKSNVNLIHKNESEFDAKFEMAKMDSILEQLSDPVNFKQGLDSNSARVAIGNIEIDIPQHPVALHGMMTRSGRHLSTTLQELRYSRQSSRTSRGAHNSNSDTNTDGAGPTSAMGNLNSPTSRSPHGHPDLELRRNSKRSDLKRNPSSAKTPTKNPKDAFSTHHHPHHHFYHHHQNFKRHKSQNLISPFIIDFNFILEGVAIKASLLPSLQAKYLVGQVTSSGHTGSKAKFIVDINNHSLCFNAKMESFTGETNLPTGASINLPRIHVDAEYKKESDKSSRVNRSESFAEGVIFRKGSYLNMVAEISSFEHCLTTDLLNHLLFVQKVFMKEINEVLQKVSRNEDREFAFAQQQQSTSTAAGSQHQISQTPESKRILFSLYLKMTGIQITATTPTNSAVRFETGTIDLRVSNRLMNNNNTASDRSDINFKIFVRVQLDFNVALGQLIRNSIFEEAEPDFQQLAYFKTRICMRNASQSQMLHPQVMDDDDKEVVLITLKRPLVYIQPLALDKAILVWINYKNAYEYWNEQRANLNNEVLQATQQVFDKVHPFAQSFSSSSPSLGTLLLQLAVDDFGICLPMSASSNITKFSNQTRIYDSDIKDALVLTLESTRISALSRESLVSQGEFKNLCIRFADDFGTMLDDWKPDPTDTSIQNLCIVSEGTYQICSRTITHKKNADLKTTSAEQQNYLAEAKWILNVSWKMDGFDIHVDTSIGKHITALFKTMTAIAGDEDEDYDDDEEEEDDEEVVNNVTKEEKDSKFVEKSPEETLTSTITTTTTTDFIDDSNKRRASLQITPKSTNPGSIQSQQSFCHDKRPNFNMKEFKESIKKRNIEKEFNEQAKIISDLKQLGASNQTIQQEIQRFQKLELEVFNNFRRGVMKKLKRPSNKSSTTASEIGKNRAYSTSINSYDELDKFSNNNYNPMSRNQFYKIDEEYPSSNATPSPTIKSSTISIPQLNYDDELDATNDTEWIESNETITRDKSNFKKNDEKKTANTSSTATTQPILNIEPHIDFELDVKIFFNSGKCVLHTKEVINNKTDAYSKDHHDTVNNRNYSANDMASQTNMSPSKNSSSLRSLKPTLNKSRSHNKLAKGGIGNYGHRKDYTQVVGLNPDFTVFLIPGLDIKLNYSSKNVNSQMEDQEKETVSSFRNAKITPLQTNNMNNNSLETTFPVNRCKSTKKALLFAWITLSSIPDEIFISPHLLDFFEEALKPIPLTMSGQNSANATLSSIQSQQFQAQMNQNIEDGSSVYYSSFPVDVIVFFHFQPTIIRLACLPISRVECLLHLPSIDLVMSSNRSEIDSNLISEFGTNLNKSMKNNKTFSTDSQLNANNCQTGGGLRITGCLADFSLYIFHPYGGQKNKSTANMKNNGSNYSSTDRKDSLSLQVEFVKINISRSRKVIMNDSLTQSISFSAVCDIGTATFKYDVRRLNEILAFPKAWYRKSIWKKVFIGENTLNAIFSEDDDDLEDSEETGRHFTTENNDFTDISSSSSSSSTTSLSNDFSIESDSNLKPKKQKKLLKKPKPKRKSKSHMIAVLNNPWETLVLLTVNFSKLNVSMNMGNIMGNVNWQTKELMCDGSISMHSQGHRKIRLGLCLNNSTLDAKGGIIGGIVELSDIRTEINIKEDKNQEPEHRLCFSLHTIENRIDYMGTSILMIRISDLNASFIDEWNQCKTNTSNNQMPEESIFRLGSKKRQASVFVHGRLRWDQMQVLMSKSTSPDFIKILSKLEEFFTQQFHSGKRVFDSLHPVAKSNSNVDSKNQPTIKSKRTQSIDSNNSTQNNTTELNPTESASTSASTMQQDNAAKTPKSTSSSFHKYWQKAFQLLVLDPNIPGVVLGGTIEILAHNISLACFYGVNFRSKSWAVFSLKKPSITFRTEAQNVEQTETESLETHVIQNISLVLGRHDSSSSSNPQDSNYNSNKTMAIVSKISRTVAFPPQFRHLHEWFHYAFSPVEIDNVNRFPLPKPENSEFDAFGVPIESLSLTPSQAKNNPFDRRMKSISEFQYKEEMIFAFPSMQFKLKTEQSSFANNNNDQNPPKVSCSFYSDFDDHIYVAVDAEAYFFLHDLISSYINESTNSTEATFNQNVDEDKPNKKDQKSVDRPKTPEKKTPSSVGDVREFICKVWHLEPTVRLHSWASKNIEPYGVDYILQRLGFSQARTTIPKWIQRSTMDTVDKIISIVVYQMLKKNQEENQQQQQQIQE